VVLVLMGFAAGVNNPWHRRRSTYWMLATATSQRAGGYVRICELLGRGNYTSW